MRASSRFWTVCVFSVLLVVWAGVLGQVLPLVGVASLCAWLLAQQFRFSQLATAYIEGLTVEQSVSQSRVTTGGTTVVTLTVDADQSLPLDVSVTLSPPPSVEVAENMLRFEVTAEQTTHSLDLTLPIAGAIQLPPPTVTVTDRLGLFQTTVRVGEERTVTVEPRAPRNMHVGEGGTPITVGFGEHEAGSTGGGLKPEEVRRYVPGDTIRNIDWKATARLNEPHVREFEAETDRETVLFLDHRGSTNTGPAGETKLEYLRQLALAFVDSASELSDPLGCYTIGNDGLTGVYEPTANVNHHSTIKQHVRGIEPTQPSEGGRQQRSRAAPRRAQQVTQRLTGETTPYGERLKPFFDHSEVYVDRVLDEPLVAAVRVVLSRLDGTLWPVILTDNEHETELRQAVKLARQGGGGVLVFIAPTVLFEPAGLSDLDDAYDRYREFEEFRRSLAAFGNVRAYEVGPADRVSTVLARAPSEPAGGKL